MCVADNEVAHLALVRGKTSNHVPVLLIARIIDVLRQRIVKDGLRLLERYAMLADVVERFGRVPFEKQLWVGRAKRLDTQNRGPSPAQALASTTCSETTALL